MDMGKVEFSINRESRTNKKELAYPIVRGRSKANLARINLLGLD